MIVIEIYKPIVDPPFVTIQHSKPSSTDYAAIEHNEYKGQWLSGNDVVNQATRLNCWLLITKACELPVTRIRLEC